MATATTNFQAAGAHVASLIALTTTVKALLTAFATQRVVADGVTTSASATVTSATAAFTAADVGRVVTGAGIPAGTSIKTINSGTSVVLSANATVTATAVSLTILPGTDFAAAARTGGYLTADQIASLKVRSLWTYPEAFTVASAFDKTIGYTLT